jgi:hypothetical protein
MSPPRNRYSPPKSEVGDGAASVPWSVATAAGLLVFDAVVGALSTNVLVHIQSLEKEQNLNFHLIVWIPAVLQVVAAVCLLYRISWVRYLVVVIVLALLADSVVNRSWIQAYASFPVATVRDAVSIFLQMFSGVLLLLPQTSTWFSRAQTTSSST